MVRNSRVLLLNLSDGDQFGHKVEIVDNIIFVGSKNGDDDNRSDVESSLCF